MTDAWTSFASELMRNAEARLDFSPVDSVREAKRVEREQRSLRDAAGSEEMMARVRAVALKPQAAPDYSWADREMVTA